MYGFWAKKEEGLQAQWAGCTSPANNIRSHLPGIPPSRLVSPFGGKKVRYAEYSEARNREEHPAQIKLTDQSRGAVTRGSAPALQHGGRVLGIQLDARFLLFAACQIPPPHRLHQKPSLRFPSSSSAAARSIISRSQQTLLLIKDVNL